MSDEFRGGDHDHPIQRKFHTASGWESYMDGTDSDEMGFFFRPIMPGKGTVPPNIFKPQDQCLRCPNKAAQKFPQMCEKCTESHKKFIAESYIDGKPII